MSAFSFYTCRSIGLCRCSSFRRCSFRTRHTGSRPLGWYCRETSVNTHELVVEEGGFLYDSDCYNDDLPYWTRVLGKPK